MPSDLPGYLPTNALAGPAEASSGWGEIAQRLLTQIVVGRRCQRAILTVLSEVQLTDSQLLVLWGVEQLSPASAGRGVGQTEVVQLLGISPAQVSGLVEQLRKQGDLNCQRAAHDRRLQLWHLTPAGHERLQQALRCIATLDLNLLSLPELPANIVELVESAAPTTKPPTSDNSLQHGEAA